MPHRANLARILSVILLSWPLLGSCAAWADGVLYFADLFYPTFSDGIIYTADTDGSNLQTVLDVGGGLRGIAIDPEGDGLYWTDVDADVIRRSRLDGSNPVDLITTGLEWPMGIAVHPAADQLCWGDQTLGLVGSAHLDGSGAAPLITTPFHSGIAFDTSNEKIYWTTSLTSTAGEIRRANLDGSGVETVVIDVDKPARIALDISGGKIYWTDYVVDAVRRANLDGTSVEDLYWVGANLNPGGIVVDAPAGKVYWGQAVETNRCKIMRMNLDGSNPEDVLTGEFGIITDLKLMAASGAVDETPAVSRILLEARPNPFRDDTMLRLRLAESGPVEVSIAGVDGRHVVTLLRGELSAGTWSLTWDGRDGRGAPVSRGVYWCRIAVGEARETRRLIAVR